MTDKPKIKNDPENYMPVGMVQDRNRAEYLAERLRTTLPTAVGPDLEPCVICGQLSCDVCPAVSTLPTADSAVTEGMELKPCPFCGCAPRIVEPHESDRSIEGETDDEEWLSFIECDCVDMFFVKGSATSQDEARQSVIDAWNRRALSAALQPPKVQDTAPVEHVRGRLATAEDVNNAFDPANEVLGGAFMAGFREGWLYSEIDADGERYQEFSEEYALAVDTAPQEAWDAHRAKFFAMLPLAAIPEMNSPIADIEAEIASVVQSVNEWDDRTSPDDYPEHLLITSEELALILRNFAASLGAIASKGSADA